MFGFISLLKESRKHSSLLALKRVPRDPVQPVTVEKGMLEQAGYKSFPKK